MKVLVKVSLFVVILIVFPFIVVKAQSEGGVSTTTDEVVNQEILTDISVSTLDTGLYEVASSSEERFNQESETDGFTSSTASSSEPVITEEKPELQPFILQPSVDLQVTGNSLSAKIQFENLTCKACDKALPAIDTIAYYTEWYPNDGPVEQYDKAAMHMMEKEIKVRGLGNWAAHKSSYSTDNIAPGRYYFVVEVDPNNENGAYRLFRSEFEVK